jgi:hypothetical protein
MRDECRCGWLAGAEGLAEVAVEEAELDGQVRREDVLVPE